jgi:hypothetical protein
VAESFATKALVIKGFRKHARGRFGRVSFTLFPYQTVVILEFGIKKCVKYCFLMKNRIRSNSFSAGTGMEYGIRKV